MFDSKKIFPRCGNWTRKALACVDVCLGAIADVHYCTNVGCDEACQLNGSRYERNLGSLCGWHDHSPPHGAWEKQDEMVVQVQGAPLINWTLKH